MTLYIAVTRDKYALPMAVAESITELAQMQGTTSNAIRSWLSKAKQRNVKRPRYEKVEVDGDLEKYNLTVYTYDPKKQAHETEDFYFKTKTPLWKIHALQRARYICFMDVYQWNEADDCYDCMERIERAEIGGELTQDELIERLRRLRTFCDVAALEDSDATELFASDVEALDAAIERLTERTV